MMCIRGTPKGMEASLSASFWISFWKAALSPFRNGSMRLFRIFSRTSTLFCTGQATLGPPSRASNCKIVLASNLTKRQAYVTDRHCSSRKAMMQQHMRRRATAPIVTKC